MMTIEMSFLFIVSKVVIDFAKFNIDDQHTRVCVRACVRACVCAVGETGRTVSDFVWLAPEVGIDELAMGTVGN